MEESDEPEQSISLGRQEYRRRRRPSQPMVDKSQQTEIGEKKKGMAAVQPPAPKATHSIGNIPGGKANYSGKEYESLILSSQLQQTWMKRKQGQDMTDKSFQTDTSVEEKVEVIFMDKALEESSASVGEIAPALPQDVPEVEIPTSRPPSLLIDRAQQTSCTGDWSLISICSKDKVDKEQQTYFSELATTVKSMPGSSLIKSKEETVPAEEGSLMEIDGSLEIEVLSTEQIPDVVMSFTEGEISGELQAVPDDEATVKAEHFFTEETSIQAPSLAEETSAAETTAKTPKEFVDIQALPADELSSTEPPADISPPLVKGTLSEEPSDQQYPKGTEVAPSELPVEDLVPLSEEVLEKVQALAIDTILDDSGRAESPIVEEATGEVQPSLSEEITKEVPFEVHLPIATHSKEIVIVVDKVFDIDEDFEDQPPFITEVSEDEATAEVQPPSAEDAHEEVAPSEVLPPPTEQGTVEHMTAEVLFLSTEVGPTEVPPLPTEEWPLPPETEEGPIELAEEGPEDGLLLPTEEILAEVQPPSLEKFPLEEVVIPQAEEVPLDDLPIEVQPLSAENIAGWVPDEFQAFPVDEYPVEVQPFSLESVPIEDSFVEAQLLAAEADTAEIEETPSDVALAEDQLLPTEEVVLKVEVATAWSPLSEEPPAEEATVEAQLTSVEESLKRASVDVQPPPLVTLAEESPAVKRPLKTDVVPMPEFPGEEMTAQDPLPPSVKTTVDQNLLKEHQLPEIADISQVKLEHTTFTGDKKSKGTDSVPEDVTGIKDDQISTFKIEGTIKIELKNSTP
ncbi:fibrous sheath CABYR-binding protein [Rattus rattus]|uniref:fibrous sheath CABYR-binding protein n=1 Tax=Rattus rattus TaxID=10117 RepID=UPI0013F345FF|nr:fibrous sheath CABYR-binding protein [Rattus rattus]